MIKKALKYAAIALIIFYVISRPTQAAHSTQDGASTVKGWGDSVVTFFTEATK